MGSVFLHSKIKKRTSQLRAISIHVTKAATLYFANVVERNTQKLGADVFKELFESVGAMTAQSVL